MNKFYKYLPFRIYGELVFDFDIEEIKTIGEMAGIIDNTIFAKLDKKKFANFDQSVVMCKSFKPILYPFSQLTRELPLTKAAAEILGMKEGEIIVPLNLMPVLVGLQSHKKHIEIKSEKVADFLRAMHFAVDFTEGEFIPNVLKVD